MQLTGNKNRIDHTQRKLYHQAIGIPSFIRTQIPLAKRWIASNDVFLTEHAKERLKEKGLDRPTRQDIINGQVIEIEVGDNNRITKLLIRAKKPTYDLCFAVRTNRAIVTVYGRHKDDNNSTLDRKRYIHASL